MAITKIRRISGWTLLVLIIASVTICLTFFAGGVEPDTSGNKVYANTDLALCWGYTLVALTFMATLMFAIASLIRGFHTNPKEALQGLLALTPLIAIPGVSYAIGDNTPMSVNENSAQHNTPGWLKTTDMYIYTAYILVVLITVGVIWGDTRRSLSR